MRFIPCIHRAVLEGQSLPGVASSSNKKSLCAGFFMGVLGLEPVTLSLSTRSLALRRFRSVHLVGVSGLIRRFPGSCDSLEVNGWNALYRAFRHWTGTGTVARADKQDQFAFPPFEW